MSLSLGPPPMFEFATSSENFNLFCDFDESGDTTVFIPGDLNYDSNENEHSFFCNASSSESESFESPLLFADMGCASIRSANLDSTHAEDTHAEDSSADSSVELPPTRVATKVSKRKLVPRKVLSDPIPITSSAKSASVRIAAAVVLRATITVDKHDPDDRILIGEYSQRERKRKMEKYYAKRIYRTSAKKVIYTCRKVFADARPRIGGRFVKLSAHELD